MAKKLKSVAVYCGHTAGTEPEFARDAALVGELLAKNGIRVVFGGASVGLMKVIADSVLQNGGHVTGIITDDVMAHSEPLHEGLDASEIVDGINERKQKMFELSDGFVILPGGTGTLNELSDIMTMQQVGESKKPLFFLNTLNFWQPLNDLFVHMRDYGFFLPEQGYNIQDASTPEKLIEQILNY